MRTTIERFVKRNPDLMQQLRQAQKVFALAFPPAVMALAWAVYSMSGGR